VHLVGFHYTNGIVGTCTDIPWVSA